MRNNPTQVGDEEGGQGHLRPEEAQRGVGGDLRQEGDAAHGGDESRTPESKQCTGLKFCADKFASRNVTFQSVCQKRSEESNGCEDSVGCHRIHLRSRARWNKRGVLTRSDRAAASRCTQCGGSHWQFPRLENLRSGCTSRRTACRPVA